MANSFARTANSLSGLAIVKPGKVARAKIRNRVGLIQHGSQEFSIGNVRQVSLPDSGAASRSRHRPPSARLLFRTSVHFQGMARPCPATVRQRSSRLGIENDVGDFEGRRKFYARYLEGRREVHRGLRLMRWRQVQGG